MPLNATISHYLQIWQGKSWESQGKILDYAGYVSDIE